MIQIIHVEIHDRSVNENKSEQFIFALILPDFDSENVYNRKRGLTYTYSIVITMPLTFILHYV